MVADGAKYTKSISCYSEHTHKTTKNLGATSQKKQRKGCLPNSFLKYCLNVDTFRSLV